MHLHLCVFIVYINEVNCDICRYLIYRQLLIYIEILKLINRVIFNYLHCFSIQELVQGFDQETAAVVMARYASLKMETEV